MAQVYLHSMPVLGAVPVELVGGDDNARANDIDDVALPA